MTTRILFVDDEVRVLEGLQDLLRKHRKRWDMKFVHGGLDALALLESESFDIVVTDLRMPGIDGFRLLEYLVMNHPRTVRLVLSGDPKRETALKLVPHAHRALVKPCKLGELEAALESACKLGELIADDKLRSMLGKIVDLPPLPQTYSRLQEVLANERTTHADVAAVLSSDIALSANVLKLSNSALFGTGQKVTSVGHAISVLGVDVIRTIVLSDGVMGRRELPALMKRFALELHEHSSVVARIAMELAAGNPEARRDAFAAGMLHDIGRLVMALELPTAPDATTAILRMPSAFTNTTTPDHARVGAYLLALWGVPPSVIDAVARHHDTNFDRLSGTARLVAAAEEINAAEAGERRPTEEAMEAMLRRAREFAPALVASGGR